MADYISRDDFAKHLADIQYGEAPTGRTGENIDYQKGVYAGFDMAYVALKRFPAADVVEVDVKDLKVKKAIQTLCEFYSTAKKSDYVQKPLAWALYQTWKSFDKMDGGGDK